jgi:hypothetical protein
MLPEMVPWQPPSAGSRPVPIGSRFIGVSLQPAIPRRVAPQQSPLPLHQSPTILAQSRSGEAIKCAAQPHCKDAVHALPAFGCGDRACGVHRQLECHLYFARRVTFLSCADMSKSRNRRYVKITPYWEVSGAVFNLPLGCCCIVAGGVKGAEHKPCQQNKGKIHPPIEPG